MPRLDNVHSPVIANPFSRNVDRSNTGRQQQLQRLESDVVNIRRQIHNNNRIINNNELIIQKNEKLILLHESQKEDIKKEIEITDKLIDNNDKLIENNNQQIKLMEGIIAATERIIEIKLEQARNGATPSTPSTPQQTANSTYQKTSNLTNETAEQECARYIDKAMKQLELNEKQRANNRASKTKEVNKPVEAKTESDNFSLKRFFMFENFKAEMKSIDRMFSFLRRR